MESAYGAYCSIAREGNKIIIHVEEEEGEFTVKEAKKIIEMIKKAIISNKDVLYVE